MTRNILTFEPRFSWQALMVRLVVLGAVLYTARQGVVLHRWYNGLVKRGMR